MQRRKAIQSMIGISASAAMPAFSQEQKEQTNKAVERVIVENPKLETSTAGAVALQSVRFFSAEEFRALRRLCEILVPAGTLTPGALEAHAAEFLDFLIGESPADRQKLYRNGLARLNYEAHRRNGKEFAAITQEQTEAILSPLREAWTYNGPADPFSRFLRAAKEDVLTATLNSREWSLATAARSRTAAGLGMYWFPIE